MSNPLTELRHALGRARRKMTASSIASQEVNTAKKFVGGTVTSTLLVAHALEKGMGIQNVKKGYGIEKAKNLCELLQELKAAGRENEYAYQEGLAVLWAYIRFQESTGVDVGEIRGQAEKLGSSNISNAGYKVFTKEELTNGTDIDFGAFLGSKHSVRKMTEQEITREEMETAVRYAGRAPSACNRQPSKVYYSLDHEKNKALAALVPGNKGFSEDIPYYCVVTADRTLFGSNEMFQWFVNGGIFVGYFVLALHSFGIGSCVFQWPAFNDQEQNLRDLIHAGEREAIIAIVGYGKYPDEAKCICAERKPIEDVAVTF